MIKSLEKNEPREASATVLVVDDAALMRFLVSKTLNKVGFCTLIAADGEAALTSIRDSHPDAVVTDLEMPGMNGVSLISALKQSKDAAIRKLPIIVCSSTTDRRTLVKLSAMGVNAVVPKPVNVRLLASEALKTFAVG